MSWWLVSLFALELYFELPWVSHVDRQRIAHGNTLRGLVKTIDNISDEDIQNIAIPTVRSNGRKLVDYLACTKHQPIAAGNSDCVQV